jgi:hypothetical protein
MVTNTKFRSLFVDGTARNEEYRNTIDGHREADNRDTGSPLLGSNIDNAIARQDLIQT